MTSQEVLERTNSLTFMSVNDYIEAAGEVGAEWFDNFKIEPYFHYSGDYENDVTEDLTDEFEDQISDLKNSLDNRFELQAIVDENGKAELLPMVYDVQEKKYLSLDELAEEIEENLPTEVRIIALANPSYSWEDGWDYDEVELIAEVDADVHKALYEEYESIKKEATERLENLTVDNDELKKYFDKPENKEQQSLIIPMQRNNEQKRTKTGIEYGD